MSTFIFAPNWVTYPNQHKTLKESDEFPALLGHNSNNNVTQKETDNNNIWSNFDMIHKLHHLAQDEATVENEELEERRYELERLKALVPKTRKSLSASTSTSSTTTTIPSASNPKKQNNTKKVDISSRSKKPTSLFTSKQNVILEKEKDMTNTDANKAYLTKEEQRHFIYFIQSWTSTGFSSHYYSANADANNSNHSYFYRNPFPN
ncbi:uncharacterized protein B0P05DRAFT_546879 [Gilbertella persicaria]|uniref:uncharacterized protein n=1 Tax=Gilbertella persicaria TaxID=101096 RepID=UPI002220A96A|nr:uncharacterized protein B0P05DRAFT_546879 [Gilbertella persicaria]KAI8075904.1 hypothetical protein B0P05DRAFT_546879 [Gilbertella persicaria]